MEHGDECISGLIGTWFDDQLARGARGHVQEMDLTRPALPAYNRARQHARTHAWTWEVVFATAAKHGQTWGWRSGYYLIVVVSHPPFALLLED